MSHEFKILNQLKFSKNTCDKNQGVVGRMKIESGVILLIAFLRGLEIGDTCGWSRFYWASEIDVPQAIALDYFIGDPKSKGRFQQLRFY